jgi:acylphosphatase
MRIEATFSSSVIVRRYNLDGSEPDWGGVVADAVRAHVVVNGLVQGVFFRAAARDEALARGLGGCVRNEMDGSLVAEFEGPGDRVREAVEWMAHGPSSAIVEDVQITWMDPAGETSFQIRY